MYALCTPSICVFMMFGLRRLFKPSLVEIHGSIFAITPRVLCFFGCDSDDGGCERVGDEQ